MRYFTSLGAFVFYESIFWLCQFRPNSFENDWIGKIDEFCCLKKGEGDTMKFLDALISNGIFVLAIGMVLYLAITLLAMGHFHDIFDCPICNNVDMVSSQIVAHK